jgi:hypothetical protein
VVIFASIRPAFTTASLVCKLLAAREAPVGLEDHTNKTNKKIDNIRRRFMKNQTAAKDIDAFLDDMMMQ